MKSSRATTYVIKLILILHAIFTDVLLQSSDLARALSNDLGVDVPDDINFAINPEQVVDRVGDDSAFCRVDHLFCNTTHLLGPSFLLDDPS